MEYPLISEYRDAILSAEDNFKELSSLRPVLDGSGNPVMSSGNFAVVFKMIDENDGKLYAVKCFIKEQEGRNDSYRKIADELDSISSPYIVSLRFLEDELFVDSAQCECDEFPVVLMDWVEGESLDAYLQRNLSDKFELDMLSYRFNMVAAWLLSQPFAHGDLKPDNILVRADGSLVLVDYDGMFVPAMKGEKAREIGSPNYRHPLRTDDDFDEHIDDFPLAIIALSLKAIALKPELSNISTTDTLLFAERDFCDPSTSAVLKEIQQSLTTDSELSLLLGTFFIALAKNSLELLSFRIFITEKHKKSEIDVIEKIDTKVTEKEIAGGVEDEFGVIYSKDGTRLLKCPDILKLANYNIKAGTKVICNNAFSNCSSLYRVNIPPSVISIGDEAFSECESLQNVSIPSSVISIGDGAFSECEALRSVIIPSSVTSIGYGAFYCCVSLQNAIIPPSVTLIGNEVFRCCSYLQSVIIPSSVTSIGDDAFTDCASLQNVIVPSSVTSIGDSAFNGCASLRSVIIPPSVTSIGACAFSNCASLQSIIIPSSVTSIDDYAFSDCTSLQNVNIPSSVILIGNNAFRGCESLQSISIPSSVISIGARAFEGCESLQSVTIPSSVTSIGDFAFRDCSSLRDLNLPASVKSLGDNPFIECDKLHLSISEKSDFVLTNGFLINLKGCIISCLDQSITIDIPKTVTSIGNYAFSNCASLQNVSIPSSVTSIGASAFEGCASLQSVVIPSSVTSIGNSTFEGCRSLQSIVIPSSVTSIGNSTFEGCASLQSVVIPSSVTSIGCTAFYCCVSLESVIIPSSVRSIGNGAFSYCPLQYVNIPPSVSLIGVGAFKDCKSLQSVVIHGSLKVNESNVFPAQCNIIYKL